MESPIKDLEVRKKVYMLRQEYDFINKNKPLLINKVHDYLLILMKKNKIIDNDVICNLKKWCNSTVIFSDKFFERKFIYSTFKKNYLEYNNFIRGYSKNIKIQV